MDYQALADEINNDPEALGYGQHLPGDHNSIVALLKQDDPTGTTYFRTSIPMSEVYAEVEWVNEWLALTDVEREGFRELTSTDAFDASSQNVRDAVEAIFGNGSQTWANLGGIVTRPARREEVVLERGSSVTSQDVAKALQ